MGGIKLIISIAIFLFPVARGFIFDEIDDASEKTLNVMNYKYPASCLKNDTIATYVDTFRSKYDRIRDVKDDDVLQFRHSNFSDAILEMCSYKHELVSSITDFIHHIANECVRDAKLRKKFTLNTLLSLQFQIDFLCSLNEDVFNAIFIDHVEECISNKSGLLEKCREKSFSVLFFDSVPQHVTWLQLLNAGICNFNYDDMKLCAAKPLESCDGGGNALNYLLDIIKRNSLCFERKSVTDIIEDSWDSSSTIVT